MASLLSCASSADEARQRIEGDEKKPRGRQKKLVRVYSRLETRVYAFFSKTSRWWSSSSRSKQTLLALTPEVKASRKSALVSQRGSSWSLSSVFLALGAANRLRHWRMVSM